jgi:hypothetical protein
MAKNQSFSESLRVKRNLWKHHVESWNKSDLSQAEYCRQHNLKVYDFQYWKKRFKTPQELDCPNKLLPVKLISPDKAKPVVDFSGISLRIADRYIVQLGVDFNGSTLSKLIDILEVR